jgi:tetratricopeptide (TPR) repeat protein
VSGAGDLTALPAHLLQQGDFAGADRALASLGMRGLGNDPHVLRLTGMVRLHQLRFGEAETLFARARVSDPENASVAFYHGMALVGLKRDAHAALAYGEAVRLKPDSIEAQYALASACHRMGMWEEAERHFRSLLEFAPDYTPAHLALGGLLIDMSRPVEAEAPLRRALAKPSAPQMTAQLHANLGMSLRRQHRDKEALRHYDMAAQVQPSLSQLNVHKAEALQNLGRHDEALSEYRSALALDPADLRLHRYYNDLLYRLGRTDEYLKSYEMLPNSRALQLEKASFLMQEKKGSECLAIYRDLLANDQRDIVAAMGCADSLLLLDCPEEAGHYFERLLADHDKEPALLLRAAKSALLCADPKKALMWCRQALVLAPYDQNGLATMSICLRMLNDERDEVLNGYDSLIRVFDLEPPQGFSTMEAFNAELRSYLDHMHIGAREYAHQSLRKGTQTTDHLFGAGHALVDRLQTRIGEAVRRYVRELPCDDHHPFLSRRREDFCYVGSWSSRLREGGFHVNHVHQDGWISSCYYAAVPEAAKDENARQGWINFGEPEIGVVLKNPVRRSIQPALGRLVLFPSYVWHGTTSFCGDENRTTIAFDALPAG